MIPNAKPTKFLKLCIQLIDISTNTFNLNKTECGILIYRLTINLSTSIYFI